MGWIFGLMMRRFSNLAIGAGVPSSVQVIEVEVDTWLGHVRVLNVHTGIAVGKIAAPALARSQAAGSVIQGIGYALYEAREIDPAPATSSPAGWRTTAFPASPTRPTIDVHFDEGGFDHVLGGSVGIGEVATVPTSPAIANAIRNATGIRLTEIADPARPPDRRAQREGRRMTPAAMTAAQGPEFRAAGTDLSERRRSGVSTGPLIDIAAAARHDEHALGRRRRVRIGAFTTIAAIAADARIAAAYPGLAAAAQGLATPQIRHLATLGGNLAQRSRCWYFRNPHIACLKKGGSDCPARSGNHLYGVAFDLGPCVAPHPSTMAAALLAYDATVVTDQRGRLTIARTARRRLQRHRRQRAAAGRNDQGHRAARRRWPASARSTSAPSAAPMRNGRWSKSAPAP